MFAERTGGGFFLDIEWNRDELARYGLSVEEAQAVVQNAIGGENVTTTVEGRERYPVNVRYMRDFRSDFDSLSRVLVPASGGQRQIPLGQLATIKVATGPAMIRNEDGLLTGYVFVDVDGRDLASYVEEADALIRSKVPTAAGLRGALERPVRGDGARARAPHLHRPADAVPGAAAALPEHPVGDEDRDRRRWPCRSRPSAPSGISTCSTTT